MKYKFLNCFLFLFSLSISLFSQTQQDAVVFYELKDALWNQTATTAKDSGTPGDKNGTISGTGVKFVNNGGGGTAIEYSITTNDAKIDGVTADWGEKFVLEARIKKSALEEGGTNSEIHILKNVVTTGLDWFINTDGKMVFKVGDGTSINVISQNAVLADDSWTTLAVAVDLTKTTLADAIKFFVNGAAAESGEGDPEPEPEPVLNEVVFDETVNRNLSAEPIDITGLDGDLYDYTLVINADNGGVSNSINLTVNGDTTANYRNYYMRGEGSSPYAVARDTESNFFLMDQPGYVEPGLAIVNISGGSTEEKTISAVTSGATSSKKIYKMDGSWKNTSNKLTSIQVRGSGTGNFNVHVRAFRTPKNQTDDNWELVGSLNWNNESTEKSFTGLDGDTDKKYKIVWKGDQQFNVKLNNDSANYMFQRLRNNNGSLQVANTSSTSLIIKGTEGFLELNAQTGSSRLVIMQNLQFSSPQQAIRAYWYSETATNITTLDCYPAAAATGNAYLYKLKDPTGVADVYNLPFQKIAEVDINGDLSAGHVFDNLNGDSQFIYKLEWLGENAGPDRLDIQFNNDSGSSYTNQVLQGSSSSISAASTTNTEMRFAPPNAASKVSSAEMYIYPKSGEQRTILTRAYAKETVVRVASGWWNNTSEQITSIKVFCDGTNAVTGKLILSAIPLNTSGQQAQPEEEPVYAEGSSVKVFEFEGNRNLNTNPITINNLDGDLFDYKVIFQTKGVDSYSYHQMTFNGDSGANYREYAMQGRASVPAAWVNNSRNYVFLGETGSGGQNEQLKIIDIKGKSGSERYVDLFFSNNDNTNHKVSKHSGYWKNIEDKITTITLSNGSSIAMDYHILVNAIPKTGDKGNWELISEEEVTGQDLNTTPISFTGLDGDTDEQYKIEFDLTGSSVDSNLAVKFNGTGNYNIKRLLNSSGSLSASNNSRSEARIFDGEYAGRNIGHILINAKSGSKRYMRVSSAAHNWTAHAEEAIWWDNTSTNITSIEILDAKTGRSITGSVKLYKKKGTFETGGDLHWETVDTFTINGDFSGGHTFSGLTGNSETLYKIEGDFNGSPEIHLQINNDSGANYPKQLLNATNTSISASNINLTSSLRIADPAASQPSSYAKILLYPKSGSKRAILGEWTGQAENRIQLYSAWWNNSTVEINSIKVYASNGNPLTGSIKLSRLVAPPVVVEEPAPTGNQVALDASSVYTENIYPTISGENAIEMLTKTGDFSLQADFLKMTLKRTDGAFDEANIQIGEGYRVDANYNVLTPTASKIFVYPPKLLRRVYNPPGDFDALGRPKAGVTVDIVTSPVVSKVYYGLFQFEFALDKTLSENVTVDVFMKTNDFDFKKIAEVSPTAKPADPEAPWIIKYYWNSRLNQFDWDGNAYKTAGAVEFKFEVR